MHRQLEAIAAHMDEYIGRLDRHIASLKWNIERLDVVLKGLKGFAQKVALAQKRGILHKKSADFWIGNTNVYTGISSKKMAR